MMINTNIKIPGLERALADFSRDFKATVELVGGIDEVHKKFGAEFALYPELGEELDQYNLIYKISAPAAREKLAKEMADSIYCALCRAFIRLRDRGAFNIPAISMTDEMEKETNHMEIWAGVRERPAPPAPPVIPPTAEELLRDEVILDFNGDVKADPPRAPLSADVMREKCRTNIEYRKMYYHLAETNQLQSSVTQNHDLRNVGS